ncbi:MAG: hypothetical protein UHS47_08270, partial [Oscillospiraceae bacterium]|nr:hypothetical protein [Oscillospiraceae bacterium]
PDSGEGDFQRIFQRLQQKLPENGQYRSEIDKMVEKIHFSGRKRIFRQTVEKPQQHRQENQHERKINSAGKSFISIGFRRKNHIIAAFSSVCTIRSWLQWG